MENSNINFETKDIIITIESEVANALRRDPRRKSPPVVALTRDQYKAYLEAKREGRKPTAICHGLSMSIPVRMIS